MHYRGLKQFCSVTGKEPQGHEYISRFFDAALDKIGQILWTANALDPRTTRLGAHLHSICLPF
jgi:hypothetical protein